MTKISSAGERCVSELLSNRSEKRLYELSSEFSKAIGLETKDIADALSKLRKEGHAASMCMLGNSIFTNAAEEEIFKTLGNVPVISCASGNEGPIIRKA
jgi:pantoate kinase